MIEEFRLYPVGTKIQIGERVFVRRDYGTFWVEIHAIPGNCNTRPSSSIHNIEEMSGLKHKVIE